MFLDTKHFLKRQQIQSKMDEVMVRLWGRVRRMGKRIQIWEAALSELEPSMVHRDKSQNDWSYLCNWPRFYWHYFYLPLMLMLLKFTSNTWCCKYSARFKKKWNCMPSYLEVLYGDHIRVIMCYGGLKMLTEWTAPVHFIILIGKWCLTFCRVEKQFEISLTKQSKSTALVRVKEDFVKGPPKVGNSTPECCRQPRGWQIPECVTFWILKLQDERSYDWNFELFGFKKETY